jgi:hypothetical protein
MQAPLPKPTAALARADTATLAAAEQHNREQVGDSTAEVPAASLQPQQRKRRSEHGVSSKTGSKRHKGSGSSNGATAAAIQQRKGNQLPVLEQPEGVWRVAGIQGSSVRST